MESDEFAQARFMLLAKGMDDLWYDAMVLGSFSGLDAPPSEQFAAAARQINSCVTYGSDQSEQMDIPVLVVCETHGGATWGGYARVLDALQALNDSWRFPVSLASSSEDATSLGELSPSLRCALVLELDLVIKHSTSLVQAEEMMRVATKGNGLGIELSFPAALEDTSIVGDAHKTQAFGNLCEQLLCANDCHEKKLAVLNKVEVSGEPALLARLCSAFAATRTTNTLGVNGHSVGERVWVLLVYALFSKESRSSVTHLSLEIVRMGAEDADAIRAVLQSDDPIGHLFGRDRGVNCSGSDAGSNLRAASATAPVWTSRKRGTTVTIQQMHPDEQIEIDSATWTLATDVTNV